MGFPTKSLALLLSIFLIYFSCHFYGSQFYAPQTKILEGLKEDEIRIFDILFNGS